MLYRRKKYRKDTSKRNLVTKFEQRDRFAGIYYAIGRMTEDKERIELITDNPELIRKIREDSEKQSLWVFHYTRPEEGYSYLTKAGELKRDADGHIIPRGLFYIAVRKMTWNYKEKRKYIKKYLKFMVSPYFLQMLYLVYGTKEGDTATIDMSSYMWQDLTEIVLWYHAHAGYEMKASKENMTLTFSVTEFHQALEERKWREVNLPSKKL